MRIEVRDLSPADEARWTAFVHAHPQAKLYHSLRWRDVVREAFGQQPIYLLAERGPDIQGVLPLFLTTLPVLGAKLTSLPYDAGSGGPLALDPDTAAALAGAAIQRAQDLGVRYLELRCDRRMAELEHLPLESSEPVLLTDVLLGPADEVLRRVKPDQRRSAGAASRRGVTIRAATSLPDVRRFYDVYCRVFRSMGTPPYGWRYFDTLWRHLGADGAAVIHLAEADGTCLGGALLFCSARHIVAKFILTLPDAAPYRASAALFDHTLRYACERRAECLSWGTSAPHQQGLIDFKERWAGRTRPVVIYGHAVRSPLPDLERLYDSNTVVRRAWRHLPLSLTKIGGAMLNRWYC